MEAVDSRQDQLHHAAAAINGEPEVELVVAGAQPDNAAPTLPAVEQQGRPEERADGGRRPPPGRALGLVRRLRPAHVARACGRWLRHPAHLALVAWALCVAASGSMLGLLLAGALNGAFPRRSLRNRWVEINNQVLNALFTLMSLYQHPALFHHAALLLRWRPGDATELRKTYCRKGGRGGAAVPPPRRGERAHMSVVVALLHATCFAQYAMCGLYWGYSRKARPDAAGTALTVAGTATPVLAALYMYFSPLGRKRGGGPSVHQEPDDGRSAASDDGGGGGGGGGPTVPAAAEWAGGLLDVGEDPTAWWLSCLFTFCVFGWNMERLGLGSARLHTAMFALLCLAPLWVLSAAALNIRDEDVADAVGAAGAALCALGLLYGGFWRARMRRRHGLPGGGCLGDYLRWMFCWSCALAQEVRTGNLLLLDVEAGGSVHRGEGDSSSGGRVDTGGITLQPLPRENRVKSTSAPAIVDKHTVPPANTSPCRRSDESPLLRLEQGSSSSGEMTPPVPPSMPDSERR